MDKDQILSFVKKNAFALACGVIAIVAVVAAYYPFGGMVQQLQDKSAAEANGYQTLTAFTRPRHVPLLDPSKATPVDLSAFPTHDQVKAGQDAVAQLTAQSSQALDALVALNNERVHPQLVPGALPNPISDTPKFLFADVYKKVLSTDPDMSGLGSPRVPPPVQANPAPTTPLVPDERLAAVHAENLFNDVLHAAQPADTKLIDARKAWLADNVYASHIMRDGSGAAVNQTEVTNEFTAAAKQVPDQLNQELAATKQVYLDRDAFSLQPSFVASTANPQLADIWFAQLSFWMQRDMAEAVATMNAGGKGIAASPVKRILKLTLLPVPMYLFPTGTAATGGPSAATETQALPTSPLTPTGRGSNAMYDVVPFRLVVDVEVGRVNDFLQALVKDRLIYVTNQDLFTVDTDALAPQGYLYGSRSVVRLSITGEELFLRKWTVPLMPDSIKIHLGLLPPPPGSTVGPWGGAAPQPGASPDTGMPGGVMINGG